MGKAEKIRSLVQDDASGDPENESGLKQAEVKSRLGADLGEDNSFVG